MGRWGISILRAQPGKGLTPECSGRNMIFLSGHGYLIEPLN
jgi:hypothetical protein